ncbi:MAG: ATP-binding cassette domain-containing protein [Planctomycetes bacterium]|nr:ATP-binding cassette domain-containing protein [Planctomycetota bacterium]
MFVIDIRNCSKLFDNGQVRAVDSVNLKIEAGETLVLLGSSGSGKSTLLRMVNRLLDIDEGNILLRGQDVSEADPVKLRRSIGYVFQEVGLFPHMSVGRNLSMPLRLSGSNQASCRRREHELLTLMELPPDDYIDRFPFELSGGQRQRVGVARALAADPDLLLMDEPFGALDALTRDQLQLALIKLRAKLNKTILFVTHDLFEALRLGDRIAVLHEGRLEQVGTAAELMRDPATPFVRDLFAKPAELLSLFKQEVK